MTIPTDEVDPEPLRRPAHWDLGLIQRFMLMFGPISSLFDFLTFGVMLWVFHAGQSLFQTGWFVESLATQTLIIFVIRTRRTPFFRSRPSLPLTVTSLACVAVGAAIPFTPVGKLLGFWPLPPPFFLVVGGMVVTYLVLVEIAKTIFYRMPAPHRPLDEKGSREHRLVRRWAMRWSRRRSRGRPFGLHQLPRSGRVLHQRAH
jgi:Mg2+-importing ATPase